MPLDRVPASSSADAGQRGQASVEYSALLAVVAVVLVAGATALSGAGLFNAILEGWERALCTVTGQGCQLDAHAPCTVSSGETGGKVDVTYVIVKGGTSFSVLRERRSDGTISVTLAEGVDGGVTTGVGAGASVSLGGRRIAGGRKATADLLLRLGRRQVWNDLDEPAADDLISRITKKVAADALQDSAPVPGSGRLLRGAAHLAGYEGDKLPRADVEALSAKVQAQASVKLGAGKATSAGLKASLGGTRDRDGNTTAAFAITGSAARELSGGLLSAGVSGEGEAVLSVVYDKAWRPTSLKVAMYGTVGAKDGFGGSAKSSEKRRLRAEITASLDLTASGANREAYDRMMHALGGAQAPRIAAAAGGLASRLADGGLVEVRRFDAVDKAYGAFAEAALGGKLGGGVEVTRSTSRLNDAWTRPAGGAWVRRDDCLDPIARA